MHHLSIRASRTRRCRLWAGLRASAVAMAPHAGTVAMVGCVLWLAASFIVASAIGRPAVAPSKQSWDAARGIELLCPADGWHSSSVNGQTSGPSVRFVAPLFGDVVNLGEIVLKWQTLAVQPADGDDAVYTAVFLHHNSKGVYRAAVVAKSEVIVMTHAPGTVSFRVEVVHRDGSARQVDGCPNSTCVATVIVDVVPTSAPSFTLAPVLLPSPMEDNVAGQDEDTVVRLLQESGVDVASQPHRLRVSFVGSTLLDGQKMIWLSQVRLLPRAMFDTRYVVIGGSLNGTLRQTLDDMGIAVTHVSPSIQADAVSEAVRADPLGSLLGELRDAQHNISNVKSAYAQVRPVDATGVSTGALSHVEGAGCVGSHCWRFARFRRRCVRQHWRSR